ncbi:MAG TPA: gephyrin-like molybdotransferase Glp, partial [Candidatus Limnocylindria bacterium]|nr:gephyrin-like molybdotransferase Glp [Candidatus Limnocylindria bacterium]
VRILAAYRGGARRAVRNRRGSGLVGRSAGAEIGVSHDLPPLMPLEVARARMLDGLTALPTEVVALGDAAGRVLAEDLVSRHTLPPWDNSAMDGFAVLATDTSLASRESPSRLEVVGEAAAGRVTDDVVTPGTAVRILTGAPLPKGADAVVPVENTDAQPGVADLPRDVSIHSAASPGAHVRRAGSDLIAGAQLLAPGIELTPAALAVAAAGGHARVTVQQRPRVAILATGDELVAPGEPLGPAQIPDSNTSGLAAQARELGADVQILGIARDELADVLAHLRRGLEWADVIVASGGVSVGAHDVVKDAFNEIGHIDLWRIAVQPGRPLAFGRAKKGSREVLLFGLPGNPVSSLVTFELFVRPVLRRLAGHEDVIGRDIVRATLEQPVSKAQNRRAFIRVKLTAVQDGNGWRADLAGGQDSHVLSALAAADGLAIIGEEHDSVAAGTEVEVIRIR